MRIIAGVAKGRRLLGPSGSGTRPMTDRAREALFSSLGERVVDARVFDLYAGTGSLGLEALSRGAASAVFVERDRRALAALRTNIEAVGMGGTVVAGDVERFLARTGQVADLAFVDPPYALSLASVRTVMIALRRCLVPDADVIVHRRVGEESPVIEGLSPIDERRYGDSKLWRFRKEQGT